jgi:hypothetical protein
MSSKGPEKARDKFNLYTQEEIRKSIAEIEEVKKQIEKRTEQIKKISDTSINISINTVPGNITIKNLNPQKPEADKIQDSEKDKN